MAELAGIADQFATLQIDNTPDLLAVHGGDVSLLADGEGVGHSLSRGLGGDNKVIATLLDLSNGLDVLGHLDDISWKFHGPEELLVVLLGVDLPCSTEVHVF